MKKNIVTIEARVYAPTNFNSENKVELVIREGVRNPKFPQAVNTSALFKPNNEIHMRKATLDFLLLNQGKSIRFGEKDKVVTVTLDNIPAEFIKGYKKDGTRYFAIKADLSTTPGESHNKWFFAESMYNKLCEEFVTEHQFEESEESDEELKDDEDDEEKVE